METDEILRRSQTASRIAPDGARSTIYGSNARRVPAGILAAGTEPMPARSSFVERPATASDPRLIERMRARPTVDPEVGRRLSTVAEGVQRPSGSVETRPIKIDRLDPSRAQVTQRAPTAGATAKVGKASGLIRQAASQGGGRIASALQSPTGRVVRGIAGTAGAMAAFPTGAMAYDNLVNQPGAEAKALGAAQALLAGSAAIPGPLGEVGRMGNLGYQAIVNSDLPARISRAVRSALGMREDAGEAAPVGASSNPSPLVQQIPTDRGTTGSAARVPSPAAAVPRPGLGEPVAVGERPPGPITKAAQKRAPINQPVGEPAPKAPPVVSPPAATESPAEQGGIQVFGPHNGYAGAQPDPETPGMYYLPKWDGDNLRPAPANGEVFVTRGAGVGSQQNIFNSQTGVERADMPTLEGTSVEQLVRFMAATQGSSDARVAAANKAATDLLRAQLDSAAAAERQRVASEASVKSAGISAGGGIRQAEIQSAANRYLYQPGQRVTDMMGNTTYTDPAVFDRQTGTPLPGKTKPTKTVRPMSARSQMIKLIAEREGVDDRTAAYLVDQAFEFVK